jgi:hypothetical protein
MMNTRSGDNGLLGSKFLSVLKFDFNSAIGDWKVSGAIAFADHLPNNKTLNR